MKLHNTYRLRKLFLFTLVLGTVLAVVLPMAPPKDIPASIQNEVTEALSFYPELQEVPIEFKFKKHIKKSTMQAQPKFRSLLKPKKKRSYVVLISEQIKISDKEFLTADIPYDVMVGWLGHELGHIVDYQNRSNLNLTVFGAKYLLSPDYIKSAERTADSIAVSRGMGEYIIATKQFILEHAEISEAYKERLRKFYLSPEEIMVMIKELKRADDF